MKRFKAEDLPKITYVSWPAISHDGKYSACVKYKGEEETGGFPSAIHLINNETGEEYRLTDKGHSEKMPVFLRNSDMMLFLSDESGEWQVWSRDIDCSSGDQGGTSKQLTHLRHGVIRYDVSEATQKITFEALLWPQEVSDGSWFSEMDPEEKKAWEEKIEWTPYVASDLIYKMDDWFGMRKGEFSHIGYQDLLSAEGGETHDPVIVDTKGKEAVYPAWSHDGKKLAFHCYIYGGAKGRNAEVAVFDTETEELITVTKDIGIYADHMPLWTADDNSVIACGFPQFDDYSTLRRPYCIDTASLEYTSLISSENGTDRYDVDPAPAGRTERADYRSFMTLDREGKKLYFRSFREGSGIVCSVSMADPARIEIELEGRDIYAFALSGKGDIAYTEAGYYEPADLYYMSHEGRGSGRLTHSNDWLGEYSLGEVREGVTKSRDGETDLQYWIVTPPGFDPEAKYPAVYDAKGGPETCYGRSFWHEFQTLAAKDIVVIYGNPRGSVGYGRAFNKDAVCWGDKAMLDHLTIIDAAIAEGYIDTEHLGFTGGSYGGYMTMKLIGRTDTFTAAVAQRALANPVTSYGTGDMGFISSGEIPEDFTMMEYLKDRGRNNIISYVDEMKTPLLILHASDDYRCGFEQAEQIFIPMHERNPEIPLRLVRFPGENHGLTRMGRLHSQMRHLKELSAWFRRYLVDEPWKRIDTGAKYGCEFEGRKESSNE